MSTHLDGLNFISIEIFYSCNIRIWFDFAPCIILRFVKLMLLQTVDAPRRVLE